MKLFAWFSLVVDRFLADGLAGKLRGGSYAVRVGETSPRWMKMAADRLDREGFSQNVNRTTDPD